MAQNQIQELKQEQKLQQSISAQQLLQSQLIELPITQLRERVETEMHDNPALEMKSDDDGPEHDREFLDHETDADSPQQDYEQQREKEDRRDAMEDALENIGRDDEDPPIFQGVYSSGMTYEDLREETLSLYDQLRQQMNELQLPGETREVMEYLIGSIDEDGLLRKDVSTLAEEMAIYNNIEVSAAFVGQVLQQLQEFDPAGIGARSLQECLLLQIARKDNSNLKKLMDAVVREHFDDFTKNHWDRIREDLSLNEVQVEALQKELRRLNPRPGSSVGLSMEHSLQQVIPDFIVDTQEDGTVTFVLNNDNLPQLTVSQSFADLLKEYQQNKEGMSRQAKEALLYTKQKVASAMNFIEALHSRLRTMSATMQAIIQLQHRFFEDGDEASLRPMILKDVADKTGLDVSTISRVSNSKYVQTPWGIFPLKYFFSDAFVTEDGEEYSTREIKAALREIIDAEDKHQPLSDDALSDALKKRGYPVARRTVAKYRDQMGLPVARFRKL